MLPTKFQFIWPIGFSGEEFKKSPNQKQELSVAYMFVNTSVQNEQYLQSVSEEKNLKNQPSRKHCIQQQI
jgi:hypothetical protein